MLHLYFQAKAFASTPAALLGEDDPFKAWTINERSYRAGIREEERRAKDAIRRMGRK